MEIKKFAWIHSNSGIFSLLRIPQKIPRILLSEKAPTWCGQGRTVKAKSVAAEFKRPWNCFSCNCRQVPRITRTWVNSVESKSSKSSTGQFWTSKCSGQSNLSSMKVLSQRKMMENVYFSMLLKRNSKLHKSLESLQSWLESIARSPRANTQAPIMVTPIDIIALKLARGNNPKGWQSSVLDGKLQAKSRCTLLTSLGPTSWRVPETWFAAIE